MAEVSIQVNGKPYLVGCGDGDEDRVRSLAQEVDARVRAADPGGGSLGETRLMLMGALVLAHEAATAKAALAAAEFELKALRADLGGAEARAVAALEAAAVKIEAMAGRQDHPPLS
jgi:cell division protein ZapA